MKKSILKLGVELSKKELKFLTGGTCGDERPNPFCLGYGPCATDCDCCFPGQICSPWVNGGGICN